MTGPSVIQRCLAPIGVDCQGLSLSDDKSRLSRAEFLAEVSTQMKRLCRYGVRPGQRVVICLPKSAVSVCILLASLAIGAVAVPVDIRTPWQRLCKILAHLDPSAVVAPSTLLSKFDNNVICKRIAVEGLHGPAENATAEPVITRDMDALALILMSSGTTGIPKGIQITHGNLQAFVEWAIQTFALSGNDRFLSVAPLHFDLSLFDILVSQSVGASVHVLSEIQVAFPAEIQRAARQERTTILYTVPTILQMVTQLRDVVLPDARWLLFAGEPMSQTTLGQLGQIAPNARCANLYGPTETNVVTCHMVTRHNCAPGAPALPIGQPCAHSCVWVVDDTGAPVPAGTIGEICVEGPTVTPGYWQSPALTSASRVGGKQGTYRTGDVGWQAEDGTLTFVGRRDQHVKIRGNFVNLAELEAVAMQSGQISAAAATLQAAGTLGARIEISVVPRLDGDRDARKLHTYLKQNLPVAYLPSKISFLSAFPQTLNGKADRQTLKNIDVRINNESI